MQLALTDLFRAKWSNQIHEEWIRNVLANRPDLKREQLERTRDLMNLHIRDCLVEGFEDLIPSMNLPDEKDRHVLAAAVHSGSDVIVTYNLKDFPSEFLTKYGIEAQHPDEFITHLIDLAEGSVCYAVKLQRGRLANPPKTQEEYLNTLEQQSLPQTVLHLKAFVDLI
jgi:hypothetical protein